MENRRGGLAEALGLTDKPIQLHPPTQRKLGPWLDAFLDYMEPFGVPEMFSIWAGLATISGVVERRLWHTTTRGPLHPSIYTLLVGPAASGKTLPINEGRRMLEMIDGRHVSPSNVSRAAFVDELNEAVSHVIRPGETTIEFNALSVMLDEVGVFISEFDRDFLAALTAMWDGNAFVERKRKLKDKINIKNVSITLIGGCTPGFLNNLIPPDAWEQGFMSRVIIAYNGSSEPVDLWAPTIDQTKKFNDLVHDLRMIGNLFGEVDYEDTAIAAIKAWHMSRGAPEPTHPQLKGYIGRRTAHLIKLCILVCASHSNNRVVTLEHYQTALGILARTEAVMGDVFLAMRKGGDREVMNETWWFAYQEYKRNQRPIPHHALMLFLSERTPNHNIERMIGVMIAAKLFERKTEKGVVVYVPQGKPPGG